MRIVFVAFPDFQTLDLTGPWEVLHSAGRLAGKPYALELAASSPTVRSSSGLPLGATRTLRSVRGPIDTLLVPGGFGTREAEHDEALIGFLRMHAPRARRVASVCTGAFLLARCGLLDGRRATTHWASCERLRRRYPAVRVEDDPIFVTDGDVWTSAGVTAGMDLALALVERDHGRAIALETARWLVMFLKRPGGQAQFSSQLAAQLAEREPLRELQAHIAARPDADLSVPALARRAHVSERTLARLFERELGMTPAAYVERARVERSQMELDTTTAPIETIAARCGFGTPETFRRAFRRRTGVSPREWRERFARAA